MQCIDALDESTTVGWTRGYFRRYWKTEAEYQQKISTRLQPLVNVKRAELKPSPKGRVHKKKCGKSMVFYQTGGGGGSPRVIKNQTPFLEKYFFSELVESF